MMLPLVHPSWQIVPLATLGERVSAVFNCALAESPTMGRMYTLNAPRGDVLPIRQELCGSGHRRRRPPYGRVTDANVSNAAMESCSKTMLKLEHVIGEEAFHTETICSCALCKGPDDVVFPEDVDWKRGFVEHECEACSCRSTYSLHKPVQCAIRRLCLCRCR